MDTDRVSAPDAEVDAADGDATERERRNREPEWDSAGLQRSTRTRVAGEYAVGLINSDVGVEAEHKVGRAVAEDHVLSPKSTDREPDDSEHDQGTIAHVELVVGVA